MDSRAASMNPYAGIGEAFHQGIQGKVGGLSSLFGGIFNDPRRSYADAQRAYDPYMDQAKEAFNPFYQGGLQGQQNLQNYLGNMQNPSDFINQLMGQYQASPYSQYLQNQAGLAGQNAASASGLLGSTPYLQQSQQNAANISSKDMQNWLANVLGINTQYGQGEQFLAGQGLGAAQGLGNLASQRAQDEASLAYNKSRAGDERSGNIFGGLLNFLF